MMGNFDVFVDVLCIGYVVFCAVPLSVVFSAVLYAVLSVVLVTVSYGYRSAVTLW